MVRRTVSPDHAFLLVGGDTLNGISFYGEEKEEALPRNNHCKEEAKAFCRVMTICNSDMGTQNVH